MTHPSDWPVPEPVFGRILADHLAGANAEPKPQVADTFTRCSRAAACARLMSLEACGAVPSNPVDDAGTAIMQLGTDGHERLQAAVTAKYPDARIEVPVVIGDLTSGSADILVPSLSTLVEAKFIGSYGWDKAVGIDRRKRLRRNAEGPRVSAKVQGALYAFGLDVETLVIAYHALEGVSVQSAQALRFSTLDRFWAEWHYPREVWLPWAERELERIADIRDTVAQGSLADRWTLDDSGLPLLLDPEASKTPWQCDYCSQTDTCVALGPGVVAIEGEDVA